MDLLNIISQPWHWSISGVMIAFVMFLLLYSGRKFGVSSTWRTMCAIGGAGKRFEFFDYNWRDSIWGLAFVTGAMIGGFIASTYLASPEPIQISAASTAHLENLGVVVPQTIEQGAGFVPTEIFNLEALLTLKGFIMMVVGGFLIGFGTRWAGGCTSGHAISGLSNLQMPSLIAVIGFFIGGLVMTHLLLPYILAL